MDSTKKKMYYIRFCYWLGAIIDGLVAVDMFLYIIFGNPIYMKSPIPTQETQYIMTSGASLMLGWTFILIWGDQKPIQRRGLLILTVFPVIVLFLIFEITLFLMGNKWISLETTLVASIIRPILIVIFLTGYFSAKKMES